MCLKFEMFNFSTESLIECQTSSDFVDASILFFEKLSNSKFNSVSMKREKMRSKMLCLNALLALAEMDLTLQINHPEYDGPR